jgi:hypothetical protein
VAAAGQLFTSSRAGALRPFARGPGGYSTPIGPEPYITLAGDEPVAGTRCSFSRGMIFALQPGAHPAVIGIGADGRARRFVSLPAGAAPNGITFDSTGRFGYRLLVTAKDHGATTVLVIDCAGRVAAITGHAPAMEGGIAVAPAPFGRYGGDLVAPDETSGRLFAVAPEAWWRCSPYPACRTAAASVSRAAALSRQGSAPATRRIWPTGTPRETGTGNEQHSAPARLRADQGGGPPG